MIRVTSLGPSALLGAAILPVPAAIGQAYQARGFIRRVRKVALPYPSAVRQEVVPLAIGVHDSRSSDSPSLIAFDMYFQVPNGQPLPMTPPVSVTSDNQMPVPAKDPRGRPAVMSKRPTFLDGRQVMQPAVAIRFPNLRARSG